MTRHKKPETEKNAVHTTLTIDSAETNFQTFFDSMDDMVVVGSADGNILHANRSLTEKLGYSYDNLKTMKIPDLRPEPLRIAAREYFVEMLSGERTTCPLPVQRKDGVQIPAETRVSIGSWNNQKCIFAIIKDLSREQEAQIKFDKLFDLNPSLMALSVLPERRFVEVNNAFLSKLGFSRDEVIGKTALELGLFPDQDLMRKSNDLLRQNGNITNLEVKYLDKSGSQYNGLFSAEVVEVLGVQYFLSVMIDITERTRAEKESAQQQLYLRTIIENQPGLVWMKDCEGKFLAVNATFAASGGHSSPETVVGLNDYDVWPKELADKYRADDNDVMSSGTSKIVEELISDQHEQRWFETFKSPVRDIDGMTIGTTGYARDITERKQAEEQLRQSELELRKSLSQVELFRTLVESSGDCFYMVDLDDDGRMCYVNEAAMRHYGATREEIYTWHIYDWDPKFTHESLPGLVKLIENEKRLHLNSEHKIADGSIVPVEITVNYMKDHENHNYAFGWFSNIAARLAAEEELRQAKLLAETANRAKSEFLANMSHEIRTPLNGVIGFTELLKNTPLTVEQRQYVDNANVSGHTLLGIINDILDFSKIEAGMMNLEVINTDMMELLGNSVDLIKFSAGTKNLEVLLDIDQNMPRFALVDPIRLKQILANLLGNAVKFTEEGEVELKVRYQPHDGNSGTFLFSVRDTGIGITDDQKERLFQAFTQADSSTTRKFGGTGLGLIISDMIARKMESRIEVSSVPDKGSTFFFELATRTENGPHKEETSLKIKRCLVIDDNSNNRLILEKILQHWHIDVESVADGLSALKLLESSAPFDIVVCDYNMPYLDGLETIRLIREQLRLTPEQLPIILLHSSSDTAEMHKKCDELGVRFRLTKPVKADDLFSYLQNLYQYDSRQSPTISDSNSYSEKSDRGLKILVAEDASMNMLLIKNLLGRMFPEAHIIEAANGKEAIEQYSRINPDLILMDVQMPLMDGVEATRTIRMIETSSEKHVSIIALTAGAFKEEQERCLAAGMDDFLTKPVAADRLKSVLGKHLSKNKTPNTTMHFDSQKLIQRCGQELAKKVGDMMLSEIPEQLENLRQSLKQQDRSDVQRLAHRLAGSALNGELVAMGALAKEMEAVAAGNNEIRYLEEYCDKLEHEWKPAHEEISRFLQQF